MKNIILSVAGFVLFMVSASFGGQLTSGQILSGIDSRIEKYRMGDVRLQLLGPEGKALPAGLPVEINQLRHKFLFGSNIFKLNRCRTARDNAAYGKYFAELLNYATVPFYWWNYTRVKDHPADERTEEIVRFCKAHDITPKGHPLAWNFVDPPWLRYEPERAMQLQMERITRCVSRFRGEIDFWDVVNEATHYDRPFIKKQAPILTAAIQKMGVAAYIRQAFQAARRANPRATLVINDYRTDPAYADKVIKKLVDEKGRPLYDVIGIQSHMHGGYWGAKKTWDVCEYFSRFHKPLHFTEVTIVSGPRGKDGWKTTPSGEARQAKQVVEFYRVLFSHPAVEAITWWDFSDQGAWQGAPAGFLRDDMSPKPVYYALKKLIKGKWWTQTTATTGDNGAVGFRGFYGRYTIKARVDDRWYKAEFSFDKTRDSPLPIQLK